MEKTYAAALLSEMNVAVIYECTRDPDRNLPPILMPYAIAAIGGARYANLRELFMSLPPSGDLHRPLVQTVPIYSIHSDEMDFLVVPEGIDVYKIMGSDIQLLKARKGRG